MGVISTFQRRAIGVLTAATVLAGCSGGSDQINSQNARFLEQFQQARDVIQNRRSPPELPKVTRALLDGLTTPSLEVRVEARDGLAYVIPLYSRRVPGLGTVDTWTSVDGSQFSFRSGVLLALRGAGDDMTSSNRAGSIAFVTGRSSGEEWPMRLDIQTEADGVQRVDFRCVGSSDGVQSLEIVELTYRVESLNEICTDDAGRKIINHYWVDVGDRTVWQARQFAGAKIGYIDTRILKK
ncbi:MAG: YjbF family lipoprotein [Pseudomonadota bacterium]